MRIAMIGQKGIPATYGGIEQFVEAISTRLADRGHEVTVFVRRHYTSARGKYRGVNLKRLPSVPTAHLDAITHTVACTAYTLMDRFDVVHYHALGPSMLTFVPRFFGIPSVATIHGLDWQRGKWGHVAKAALKIGERCSALFPDVVVTISKALAAYYLKKYRRKAVYIPTGVEPARHQPPSILNRFGLSGNDYILFVGRLVPEKAPHLLIDAFKKLNTDLRLLIVGGSSFSEGYVDRLKASARGESRIVFTGYLYGSELAQVYSNAHIFVLPSLLEGLPAVLLEALSYDNCVLASDIPPNLEVLESLNSQSCGVTFRAGDEADLIKKLQALLDSSRLVERYRSNAAGLLRKRYDWERVVDAHERVYRAAAGKHAKRLSVALQYQDG